MAPVTPEVDAPMPSGVEAMTKQQLWNWFHRSQLASQESTRLRNQFYTTTTGLHHSKAASLTSPHEIIEAQRQRMRGLEQQMGEMQRGYQRKLQRTVAKVESDGRTAIRFLHRVAATPGLLNQLPNTYREQILVMVRESPEAAFSPNLHTTPGNIDSKKMMVLLNTWRSAEDYIAGQIAFEDIIVHVNNWLAQEREASSSS